MPDSTQPDVKIHDKSSLLSSKTNGTGYNFSKSYRDSGKNKCCTATNAALTFALVLLMFGAGYIAGFFTPISFKRPNDDSHKRVSRRASPWRTKIADHGMNKTIKILSYISLTNKLITHFNSWRWVSSTMKELRYSMYIYMYIERKLKILNDLNQDECSF